MSRAYTVLLIALLCVRVSFLTHGALADGRGVFPIVIQVLDETGQPLAGASVRLVDSGKPDSESIQDPAVKQAIRMLEQPVQTDALGFAIVYYYGRWSASVQANGQDAYRQELRGRVIAEASGFSPKESDIAQKQDKIEQRDWAPIIRLTLTRSKPR